MSLRSERGATSVEYAVLVSLIAVVIVAAVLMLGRSASDAFECAGYAFEGRTCVEGTQISTENPAGEDNPSGDATPGGGDTGGGDTGGGGGNPGGSNPPGGCKSQNNQQGKGCN